MSKHAGSLTAIIVSIFVAGVLCAQSPETKKFHVFTNGTAGKIPKFGADGTSLTDSIITETTGRIDVAGTARFGTDFSTMPNVQYGGIMLGQYGGGATPEIQILAAAASNGYGFRFYGDASDGSMKLHRRQNSTAWSDFMTFTSGGYVGIGVNPQSTLHVNGITRADDRIESRKGPSDSIGAGSGFFLGNATGDLTGLQLGSANTLDFWTVQSNGQWLRAMSLATNGYLGIGTTSPGAKLDVAGGDVLLGYQQSFQSRNSIGNVAKLAAIADGTFGINNGVSNLQSYGNALNSNGWQIGATQAGIAGQHSPSYGLSFNTNSAERMRIDMNGSVGIGTTQPGTRLDVIGTALVYGGARRVMRAFDDTPMAAGVGGGLDFLGKYDTAGNYTQFANIKGVKANATTGDMAGKFVVSVDNSAGSVIEIATVSSSGLTVNGSITGSTVIGAVYQDVAEWVPATSHMSPGTVVVLNRERDNEVMPSERAYDSAVAGVVSAQPGVVLGVAGDSKAQIATTGRVKVHVDATAGAIAIGDLLVTGNKPGTAIKSQPVDLGGIAIHRPGTVIGKALQPLAGGEGEILVLLSLQ